MKSLLEILNEKRTYTDNSILNKKGIKSTLKKFLNGYLKCMDSDKTFETLSLSELKKILGMIDTLNSGEWKNHNIPDDLIHSANPATRKNIYYDKVLDFLKNNPDFKCIVFIDYHNAWNKHCSLKVLLTDEDYELIDFNLYFNSDYIDDKKLLNII